MSIDNQLHMIDTSDKERVREAVDIVALIAEFVPLEFKNREWVGICPFHDDHKPSMRVVTHLHHGFFKCFACETGGDCFSFIQKYLQLSFREALQFLADRHGIELNNSVSDDKTSARGSLKDAMKWASDLYANALSCTPEGKIALDHLHERGFTDESIRKFEIGVAPNTWSFLTEKLQSNDERIETGLNAGLLKKNEDKNRVYDAFRNRIMFPILNETGTTIAFGGRRLDEKDEPKYINSPETSLFRKSETLYGMNHASKEIRKKKQAIIVEGYTDVIACHQAGISNVIAMLGTALTSSHAEKLARYCNEVILLFDGDNAGQLAADRAVGIFFEKNIDVSICVLPQGKDPADLATDIKEFEDCIGRAIDALSFKFNRLDIALEEESTIAGKSKLVDAFLNDLVRLGIERLSSSRKPFVYERIATLLNISMQDVVNDLQARRPAQSRQRTTEHVIEPVATPLNVSRARQLAEREFLSVLLFDPTEASGALRESKDVIGVDDFIDPISSSIALFVLPRIQAGTLFTMVELITELSEESENVATSLYFVGQRICETYESVLYAFQMTLSAFVHIIEKQAIDEAIRDVGKATDSEEKSIAAEKAIESIRRRQQTRNAL